MVRYMLGRIALMVPTLVGVAFLTFFMLRVVPGDIVAVKFLSEGANVSEEMIQRERTRLGLDRSLIEQFGTWMAGLAKFDLGRSMWSDLSVSTEIARRLPLTLQLAVMSIILAVLIAVPLGVVSAIKQDTWIDYGVRLITVVGMAAPTFWVGLLLLLALLAVFGWLPPVIFTPLTVDPIRNLSQLIWPALIVGFRFAAVLARLVRSSLIETLGEDYIRTARAKGMPDRVVIWIHALRNALLPAVTVIGLEFAFLIGGLVVTEQVFNLNGLGKLFVQAVKTNDFVLIQGMVMLFATIYVVVNLAVDLIYAVLDPRIRYS